MTRKTQKKKNCKVNNEEKSNIIISENSFNIISAIDAIVEEAENSALSDYFLEVILPFAEYFAKRQDITPIQATFLALFVEMSGKRNEISLNEIMRYTNCRNVRILQYMHDIDALVEKGLLLCVEDGLFGPTYKLPKELIDSYVEDKAYEVPLYKCHSTIEFLQIFYRITHLRLKRMLSTDLMIKRVNQLINMNKELDMIKGLEEIGASSIDQVVILHLCRILALNGIENVEINNIYGLIDNEDSRFEFHSALLDEYHFLIEEKIVEKVFDNGFESNDEYKLTDMAREKLLKGVKIRRNHSLDCGYDLTESTKIAEKNLFYTNNVRKQIDDLANLLNEQNYQGICTRLREKGLRQGIACLFYGAPGTGKTESVLQLARMSGRDILQVNISDIKSKWVGDSEKNIKAIFERYRSIVKQSAKTPILLFNEADAIIGNRIENTSHSVDKMENSIQNIILQEMENLNGIMIATTNLEQNMDSAFERRFIYKIKFEKPGIEERKHIWKSMLPMLQDSSIYQLAATYDFSGGQIENIARKCDIDSILYGENTITDKKVDELCKQETINKERKTKIGFR